MQELNKNVRVWATERELHKAETAKQLEKLGEEYLETVVAYHTGDREGFIDGLGDMQVVMEVITLQQDLTMEECLQHAWDEIKDRKGKMVNGKFVKESDLNANLDS